jgi:DNA-binding MurR/RpiR family transcriptional regulator
MFRDRIQDKYEETLTSFQNPGRFILENTLDVGFLTATELARRVNVDPARSSVSHKKSVTPGIVNLP